MSNRCDGCDQAADLLGPMVHDHIWRQIAESDLERRAARPLAQAAHVAPRKGHRAPRRLRSVLSSTPLTEHSLRWPEPCADVWALWVLRGQEVAILVTSVPGLEL